MRTRMRNCASGNFVIPARLAVGLRHVGRFQRIRHRFATAVLALRFFAEAPVIGHGTGSTRGLFEEAAIGEVGARAQVVTNPHNQTLNVAVQWGVIGIAVLNAMWARRDVAQAR